MNSIEQLLNQAVLFAQQGEHEKALNLFKEAIRLDPQNSTALNSSGICLLNTGQVAESIPYFEKAVKANPVDAEIKNNLGVAYFLTGDLIRAELNLRDALRIDDNNRQSWKNLAQVYLQQGSRMTEGLQILVSLIQSDTQDTEAMFQLALCYEMGEDIVSAKTLLTRILEIDPSHKQAQQTLDEINAQAPVILPTVDIEHIARPEHAKKLASLKTLVKKPSVSEPAFSSPVNTLFQTVQVQKKVKAAYYAPGEFAALQRLASLKTYYARQGIDVVPMRTFDIKHLNEYDSFIFYNPNLSPQLIEAIQHCIKNGKSYSVDFDTDFFNLPIDHPAYTQFGQGNPNALRVISIVAENAQQVTTASPILAQRYSQLAKNVQIALPAWTDEDPWWNRPIPTRDTVNIGWMGTKADLPDLLVVKPAIHKVLRDIPSTVWVSAGCEEAYDVFSKIPEERRLFLPPPTADAMAFMLNNFDVLLIPLRETPYNQAKSDQPLLYAGIRNMPWIASSIPAFTEWGKGGFLVSSKDNWYESLSELVKNADLRKKLGKEGRAKAEERLFTH